MTNKQKQEIDFLTLLYRDALYGQKDYNPTQEQIKDFIDYTSKGKGTKTINIREEKNPLKIAKRNLDITVKLWIEDLRNGLLYYQELIDDFNNHPYILKLVNSIRKNLTPKSQYDGVTNLAIMGFVNSKYNLN